MALDRELTTISLPADADLSAGQYRLVAVGTDEQVALANGTVAKIIGVLMNKPVAADEPARVAIAGVSKCIAGGSITAGDTVVANAQGFALSGSGTTSVVAGRALTTCAGSGNYFELLIQPHTL